MGAGCRYCQQKPRFERDGGFYEWDNEIAVAEGGWTAMYIGVDADGAVRLTASGDDRADYYPKYCPECGRRIE